MKTIYEDVLSKVDNFRQETSLYSMIYVEKGAKNSRRIQEGS